VLSEQPEVIDHDVFVVHALDDTPFVKGELLPMLGLPNDVSARPSPSVGAEGGCGEWKA
jgi:hypothetical protein